jgi:FtsH-binding integral membrane protein
MMDSKFEPVMSGGSSTPAARPPVSIPVAVDSSRVLRNTYWLLALSLLPTIAGAFAGMQLNFIAAFRSSPVMTPILMFAAMMGSLWVVTLLRNSAWGVAALFGFTFISGLMLTPILTVAGGLRNGGQLVALSGGLTAAVFFALAGYATVSKRDFSFLGKFLFVGVILLLVAMVANLFFQVPAAALALSAIAVLIFSLYLLYDLSAIVRGGETNYVMATMRLFLDLFNIFINLLNLLMAFSGQRD